MQWSSEALWRDVQSQVTSFNNQSECSSIECSAALFTQKIFIRCGSCWRNLFNRTVGFSRYINRKPLVIIEKLLILALKKSFVLILVTEKSTFFAVTFFDSNSIIATIHQIFRQSLSFPGTVVQQLVGIFVDEWR